MKMGFFYPQMDKKVFLLTEKLRIVDRFKGLILSRCHWYDLDLFLSHQIYVIFWGYTLCPKKFLHIMNVTFAKSNSKNELTHRINLNSLIQSSKHI